MEYRVTDALRVLSIWFKPQESNMSRLTRKSNIRCQAVGLVNHDRMLTGSRYVFNGVFTKRVGQY